MVQIVKFESLQYDELVSVEQRIVDSKERPEVTNKLRKLLFFCKREGLYRTFQKVTSKSDKFQLTRQETLITVRSNDKLYKNCSTQSTTNPEHFVIANIFSETATIIALESVIETQNFNQFIEKPISSTISLQLKKDAEKEVTSMSRGVFLYGLGDYSRVYIAPNIQKEKKIYCVDYNYQLASHYQSKYGYKAFGLVPEESYPALQKAEKPLVIIATYHSDHTRIAEEVFELNKNAFIFIEKPPCVTSQDIKRLLSLYDKGAHLEIGYNRRFIPINLKIRELYYIEQKVITISVKEILINDSHWYFWPNQGTRITGNLTHWLDLAIFWINGRPVEINLLSSLSEDETFAVSILFSEGSLVNITVSDKGNSLRGVQEQLEIRAGNETVLINDYTQIIHTTKDGKQKKLNKLIRDKGHDRMYKHLVKAYNSEAEIRYTKEDVLLSTVTTYYVAKMFEEGIRTLDISEKINAFLDN